MAEVLLFHHAQGLTDGVRAFADELRAAGHVVHVPDLYDGRTFSELDDGVAHAKQIGFGAVLERGRRAAEDLPNELVYAGFSLGVMPAQLLTMTRPGARGALLLHSAVELAEFGSSWPAGVPVQIHTMEDDDWGDVDIARELAASVDGAELFLYPGDAHLFTDNSLPAYDEKAAVQVRQRVFAFLTAVDRSASAG
jgi:dienelactone hydrolase